MSRQTGHLRFPVVPARPATSGRWAPVAGVSPPPPAPAGGALLDALAAPARALAGSEVALDAALERLTRNAVRAIVVYAPGDHERLTPVASSPGALVAVAGIGRALEPWLSQVVSEGRSRIVPVVESDVLGDALGGAGIEWLLVEPVVCPAGRGVLAVGFAGPGVDPGWWGFATVIGALAGQHLAARHADARIGSLEAHLRDQATRDPLTGLPNQVEFAARLADAMVRADRHGETVAVAFLDLDRFRTVNDVLGHPAGDKLLQQVADRLAGGLGPRNVFRMAGDEFVLLREGLAPGGDHTKAFEVVRRSLQQPFRCDGHELFVTASIGMALYPYDGEDVHTLVKNADCAMFRAKERGGDAVECYSHGLFEEARRRLSLERSLRRAVDGDEITLEFQPQVDLRTGEITGVEALVRWRHPDLGLLSPAAFMPLAEDTGLIIPVGERIMELACRQAKEWAARYPETRVWVNLSARQFHQGDVPALVTRCLEESGLPARLLGVEVTESLAMRRPAEAAAVLDRLAGIGVKTALDDFGTGYSSLSYLSRFSIDVLKLDRAFVHRAPVSPSDATIVRAVIGLARGLGISVVAEGVETDEQRRFLAREGCERAQGYLFARPMPFAALADFLATGAGGGSRDRVGVSAARLVVP